jgi:hypothetical protein
MDSAWSWKAHNLPIYGNEFVSADASCWERGMYCLCVCVKGYWAIHLKVYWPTIHKLDCWQFFIFNFKETPSQDKHKPLFSVLIISRVTLTVESDFKRSSLSVGIEWVYYRPAHQMVGPLTNKLYRHQSKMSSSIKSDLYKDFAAGAYQSLYTGFTVSHVDIFDLALWTVAPLTFPLVQLYAPSLCEQGYSIHVYSV